MYMSTSQSCCVMNAYHPKKQKPMRSSFYNAFRKSLIISDGETTAHGSFSFTTSSGGGRSRGVMR